MNQLKGVTATQMVPVRIRNSADGKRWYARALTHDASGRGVGPEEALADLEQNVNKRFQEESIELVIRSINVSFPTARSIPDFMEWWDEKSRNR